jgi:hypothetical protein
MSKYFLPDSTQIYSYTPIPKTVNYIHSETLIGVNQPDIFSKTIEELLEKEIITGLFF